VATKLNRQAGRKAADLKYGQPANLPAAHCERGYGMMYLDHILQARQGCDFDFLRERSSGDAAKSITRFRSPAL
jgi:hypothetical protein